MQQVEDDDREWFDCWKCDGEGYSHHDCGEDTCCCADPEDNVVCDICGGHGGYWKKVDNHRKFKDELQVMLICPGCGHYPLVLSGERTTTLKIKNSKATCPKCMHEENI